MPWPGRSPSAPAEPAGGIQLSHAANVLDDPADLAGRIGAAVLASPLPHRGLWVSPRVVKRTISKYATNTSKGRIRGRRR
ncbi:hypothetical protein [Parafrankia sp. EUN1f]|uniref:hypothetical protein n=1 Tax=Parafrankia sp. EUN1f TaxID=102897 RepID=UPI0001C47424|nr:hypothetical protein [Parafrankia sp. EUN1f]EFC86328.1 hypothetical protein FrEUN1fDRAFT_0598 [Parafrankia sp. EUN1f]